MFGSECDLKMHVQHLGYHLPLKIGAQKPPIFDIFDYLLCNLTANLTAYIFGKKHHIDNRANALKTKRGLAHRLKISRTLVHKRLKIGLAFLPTISILFRRQSVAHAVSSIDMALHNESK